MRAAVWTAVMGLWLGGALASAGEMNATDRAALLSVRDSVWYAWFGNDQEKLKDLLPDDTLTISAGESAWRDRAGVLQSAQEFSLTGSKLTRLSFPRTEIQAYGDVAFVYSLYELDLDGPKGKRTSSGRATEIFVRRGGRWIHPGWHLDSGL